MSTHKPYAKILLIFFIALLVFAILAPDRLVSWLASKDFNDEAAIIENTAQKIGLLDLSTSQKNLVLSLNTDKKIGLQTPQIPTPTHAQIVHDPLLDDFTAPTPHIITSKAKIVTTPNKDAVDIAPAEPQIPETMKKPLSSESEANKEKSEVQIKDSPAVQSQTEEALTEEALTEEAQTEDETARASIKLEPFDFKSPLKIAEGEKAVVMLAGDSMMMEGMGSVLLRHLRNNPNIIVHREAVYSTGLCRDDYFNWPAHMEKLVEKHNPDLVIIHIGANDGQDIVEAKKKRSIAGTDKWKEAYGKRATLLLEKATAKGAKAIWVGLPIMGKKPMSTYVSFLSEEQAKATANNVASLFVDTTATLANNKGEFLTFWQNADKTTVRIRSNDKVHVTESGGKIILEQLEPILDKILPSKETVPQGEEQTADANTASSSPEKPESEASTSEQTSAKQN